MAKLCSVCGKLQTETFHGLVCENGHGGADSIETCRKNANPPPGYGPCLLPDGHTGPCLDKGDFEDGERIDLGDGWYMLLDASTREGGELQGFVFRPDGRDSSSLYAARELGHLTGGYETEIPDNVHRELKKTEYDRFE